MCLEKQDLCNKFKGRVQAVSPSARSPWVESKSMDYLFEGMQGTCGREAVCPGAWLSGTAVLAVCLALPQSSCPGPPAVV